MHDHLNVRFIGSMLQYFSPESQSLFLISFLFSSGRVTGSTQRPLPAQNTTVARDTETHTLGGIRTPSPSKRGPADPRLRPSGSRNRPLFVSGPIKIYNSYTIPLNFHTFAKIRKPPIASVAYLLRWNAHCSPHFSSFDRNVSN